MRLSLKLGAALAVIAIAAPLAGCAKKEADASKSEAAQTPIAAAPTTTYGTWGVDTTQRDENVKPGDDFARYANGKWLDTFEIPADLPSYSSFTKLRLDAEEDIRKIVEEVAAKGGADGSLEQKVGGFYKTWMDEAAADAAGAAPLKPYLDKIYAAGSKADLAPQLASIHYNGPVGFGILPDPADTTKYTVFAGQSGIGLPDRDYYLKTDEAFVKYRDAYKTFITTLFDLAGIEGGAEKADRIIAFETKLAEVQWTQEESRNIQKIYNPMPAAEMKKLAPEINWDATLGELGLADVPTFVVAQPSAIDKEAEIFAAADLNTLKDYLAFSFMNNNAQYLSKAFDDANYEMFSKTLRGTKEKRERWKRGVNLIDGNLGDAVGQLYVDRHFPPDSKAKMDALVSNLRAAFKERLENLAWMDEETREQALLKLSTFEPRIGYPTKYTDYSPLTISNSSLFENGVALRDFGWHDQVSQLGKPVDRERWGYPPQTVNASYNPLLNQITFPAGILQPPFFDPAADPAVNYGAIGAVIGHEIGHGFDDQGREFDEKGRIRNWWTDAASGAFKEKTDRFGAQYDKFEALPGAFVSGELTMGENIGDLGGLEMAYAAYHRHLDETSGGEAPVIDGLTGDQRFFLAWAQVWRGKLRDDALRNLIETDPHSPPYFRINGPVRNIDAWYEAFGVQPGDALYLPPEERVHIW